MRHCVIVFVCAPLLFACGARPGDKTNANAATTTTTSAVVESPVVNTASEAGKERNVVSDAETGGDQSADRPAETPYPSDPNARFRILSVTRLPNGNIEILNRRDGPSGTSYSRREVSCSSYTFRYLGEGDTLDEARANSPNPGPMSPLTGTSASSDVANVACERR